MSETVNIRVKYRPIRIGWCVKNDDFKALRKAVMYSNVLWGGYYNPIIPIDQKSLAEKLISAFRVDYLYPISEGKEVEDFIKLFDHLPSPFFGDELFPEYDGKRKSEILDINHALISIYDDYFKNIEKPKLKIRVYEWEESDALSDVFLMTFGAYPAASEVPNDFRKILSENFSAELVKIAKDGSHPTILQGLDPISLSSFDIEERYVNGGWWQHHGFYVGKASNFQDLLNFWNIRASGVEVFFYDIDNKERFEDLVKEFSDKIRSLPEHPRRGKQSIALWGTKDGDKYPEFGEGLTMVGVDEPLWNGMNLVPTYVYFTEKPTLATVNIKDGKSSIAFQLPPKPFSDEWALSGQHIVISIDPGIGLYDNEIQTLHTIYLPELNEYYGRNYTYHWNQARAEREALGLIEEVRTDSLKLHALNIADLITQAFQIANIKAETSQPGIICKHLISQMGGLRDCNVFRIKGVRELIKKYKVSESFTEGGATGIIWQDGQFQKYEDGLYIEQRKRNTKLNTKNVFQYFLKKKAFRAGLEFSCPSCKLPFWLSLDDVRSEATCEYCGNKFDVSTQLNSWKYRRSGLLGKDNHQEGAIPVIMLLEHLVGFSVFRDSLYYTTATKLDSTELGIDCESDFVLLRQRPRDSAIEIAIGECKDHQDITQDDITKLKKVVDALKKHFGVYVIFVKLIGFKKEELELFKQFDEKYALRVILLTAEDLEDHFLYKDNPKLPENMRSIVDFEDMAQATYQIYYAE